MSENIQTHTEHKSENVNMSKKTLYICTGIIALAIIFYPVVLLLLSILNAKFPF